MFHTVQKFFRAGFVSLAGAATSIIFVGPKVFVAPNTCLSHKNMLVATNTCLSRQSFCRNKHNFVATTVLSQQAYFCREKHAFFATEYVFRDKTRACRDKTFVATKIILVAAPANDSSSPPN